LPRLYKIGQYIIYCWSDEIEEPLHVHIAIVKPSLNATKIWLTRNGGCIVAHNASRIPEKDLNHLLKIIQDEYFVICNKWKKYFDTDSIKYYC